MKFKELLTITGPIYETAGEQTMGGGLFIGDPQKPSGPSVLTNKGTFNIKLPRSLDAINALLYGLGQKDFVDPDSALNVIKQKLNHFGFDFQQTNSLPDGETKIKLYQYGSPYIGVYGMTPHADVNKTGFSTDGISDKLGHGLVLVINVVKQPNFLRKVQMVIIPDNADSANCGCAH
jgi:hypothetical protein